MAQDQSDLFEKEWIENAKLSVDFGIRRFAVPMCMCFWILDLVYMPTKMYWTLFIRLMALPISYFGLRFFHKSTSARQLTWRYMIQGVCYSAMIYTLMFLAHDEINLYFVGLFVIAVGSFSFLALPKSAFVYISSIIFLPYVIFHLAGILPEKTPVFLFYVAAALACVVIFYYANSNLIRFQRKEFDSRMALNSLLKQKDNEISNLVAEVSTLRIRQAEYQKKEDMFKLARQVAHDIRAPISALNVAVKKLKDSSSDLAGFVDISTKRINDIADDMLNKSKQEFAAQGDLYVGDILFVIRSIVDEKRASILTKSPNKRIEFNLELPISPLRARVFEKDLYRALSNLIDNSIEAISSKGEVLITCCKNDDHIYIEVRDTGKGVPPEILANVGKYGFTYGKYEGSGLGLAFALNVARAGGGNLKLSSKVNQFTSVEMTLPALSV